MGVRTSLFVPNTKQTEEFVPHFNLGKVYFNLDRLDEIDVIDWYQNPNNLCIFYEVFDIEALIKELKDTTEDMWPEENLFDTSASDFDGFIKDDLIKWLENCLKEDYTVYGIQN